MANSDGQVRIIIDTNANEAVKALNDTSKAFDNSAKEARQAATVYGQFEQENTQLVEKLREIALAGGKNGTEFKRLVGIYRENKKVLNEADSAVQKATQGFGNLQIAGINVSDALKAISAIAIVRTLSDIGKSAIQTAGEFEQLETSFKIMAGGAEQGQALTNSLIELAAKTPMTTSGLARATRTLLSFGESSENVIDDLKLLGNISGGEEQRFQSLALAFAQVGSTGRLTGQDLLQMVNQGFNPLQAISEKTGKSMATLKKEMGDGKISFDMVKQAMIDATSEGGRFYGLMEEQSQTLSGRLSTLDDTWQLVSKDIGNMFLPAAKSAVNGMISLGEASQKALNAFNQNTELKSTTLALAGATTAIIGTHTALLTIPPAIIAIRNAVVSLNIASLANPIGLVAAAVGGLTFALVKHNQEIENAKNSTQRYIATLDSETSSTVSQIREYSSLINAKNRTNEQNERLSELTSELTQKYPKYIDKLKEELRLKGQISKATAEQIANEMTLAEVKKLTEQKNKIDAQVAKQKKAYQMNNAISAARFGTPIDVNASNTRKGVKKALQIQQDELKKQLEIAQKNRQKIINDLTGTTINANTNGFGGGGGDVVSSSAKRAKEVKDAFEQAQAEAQKAEKAFKLALYQSGGNVTPAVEQARLKMVDTKKAVEDVQKAYENLTAKAKTPFEQLNYNIEQSRQKIISLASQPVVNIEAIRQAQTEYQGFLAQQEQINSYLQPVKGAYQELNDKISELSLNLKNLSAEHKVGTAEWINVQTQLKETQTELDNVNKSLTDSGVKLEDYGKQISSSLSSGLVNALRNGGNAFDAFSSLATTALQKVLDKLIEMSFVTPVLNAFTGGTGGTLFSGIAKIFGSANGNVFRNGNVIPFAKGGVVNNPTIFPMANGGTGLMSEAGAEAVMPLRRMSNGRLGIEAENENGKAVQVNIYNQSGANVETRKRDDGSMDIFIRKVNEALSSERTSSGFRSAYAREDRKGVQAV